MNPIVDLAEDQQRTENPLGNDNRYTGSHIRIVRNDRYRRYG